MSFMLFMVKKFGLLREDEEIPAINGRPFRGSKFRVPVMFSNFHSFTPREANNLSSAR